MKRSHLLTGAAFSLGLSSLICGGVHATDPTTVNTFAELSSCLTASSTVCALGSNIEMTQPITVYSDVTLDLGNYELTEADNYANPENGMLIVSNGATLTIESEENGAIRSTTATSAITMTSYQNYYELQAQTARLIINGGTISGYNFGISGDYTRHNTSIVINGGTVTATAASNVAIYQPQSGEIIINDGTITGSTGIKMKSGTLEVNGGDIIGTGEESLTFANIANSSTLAISGAAVLLDSETSFAGNINVYLNNANLTSEHSVALYEYLGNGAVDTRVNAIQLREATLSGEILAYKLSGSLYSAGAPSIVNGCYLDTIISYDTQVTYLTTKKFAEVTGLADGAYMEIEKEEFDEDDEIVVILKNDGYTTESIYEIDVYDDEDNEITETDEPLTFTIDVPSEPAEGYTREWFLYFIHGDSSELQQNTTIKLENGKLTWEASKFSTYILAYKDTVIPTSPDTGSFTGAASSVVAGASVVAASAVACGAAYLVRRSLRR